MRNASVNICRTFHRLLSFYNTIVQRGKYNRSPVIPLFIFSTHHSRNVRNYPRIFLVKFSYRCVNFAVLRVIFWSCTRETILEGKNGTGEKSTQWLPEISSQFHSIVELKIRCASLACTANHRNAASWKFLRTKNFINDEISFWSKIFGSHSVRISPACRLANVRFTRLFAHHEELSLHGYVGMTQAFT